MLLLNNIRSIGQVLKLHHIPLETERKLYVHESYKRSSEVLSPGGMQYKNITFLAKVRIIIQQCHINKNFKELKVR